MNLEALQNDPAAFQDGIILATGSGAKRFGDVMADFQRERFAAVNPSLLAVAKHEPPPIPRVWDERTKGASKDSDWAVNLLWLLAFSRRPLRMQIGAYDQDQADEVRLIVKDILRLDGDVNAFLRSVVEVRGDSILNTHTGSAIEILTSDEFGGHGARTDVLLINELSHQTNPAFALTLMDNADKLPNSFVVIALNSGHTDTWQEDWKKAFSATPDRWLISEYKQPAPWIRPEALAEAEKRNPAGRYQRLWHGVWSPAESVGTPALTREMVDACFVPHLQPMRKYESGWKLITAIDLSVSRDFCAVCTLGVPDGGVAGNFRLVDHSVWDPQEEGGRVDLMKVEEYILVLNELLGGLTHVVADPFQSELLLQRLEADTDRRRRGQKRFFGAGPWCKVIPQTSATLTKQCSLLLETFSDRRFESYPCDQLRDDLLNLKLEERVYGSRLVSPRQAGRGHGDLASALCLGLLVLSELSVKKPVTASVGGFELAPAASLAEMNERVKDREARRFRSEQEIMAARRRKMQAMPPYLDSPLYRFLKKTGSSRVD